MHSVNYKKENILVEVHYAYRYDYLHVMIYHTEVNGPCNQISLQWIIRKTNVSFDHHEYLKLMPKNLEICVSTEIIALLFREYAHSFLTLEEWYSWQEVDKLLNGNN